MVFIWDICTFEWPFLQIIKLSWLSVLFIVFTIITDIVLLGGIRYVKNIAQEGLYYFVTTLASVLTLCYAWWIFANGEVIEFGYRKFSGIHITVLFAMMVLAGYMLYKFLGVYRLLKEHTVEDARAIVRGKYSASFMPIAVLAGFPMLFVLVLRDHSEEMGLGISFAFWTLMCIWLFFLLIWIPRVVIIFKYKVYQWF